MSAHNIMVSQLYRYVQHSQFDVNLALISQDACANGEGLNGARDRESNNAIIVCDFRPRLSYSYSYIYNCANIHFLFIPDDQSHTLCQIQFDAFAGSCVCTRACNQ